MKELEKYFNILLSDPNLAASPITQAYFSKSKVKESIKTLPHVYYEEAKSSEILRESKASSGFC